MVSAKSEEILFGTVSVERLILGPIEYGIVDREHCTNDEDLIDALKLLGLDDDLSH